MIDLYTGTPGSGKSLHTAELIYYALKFGRTVVCNFDINTSGLKKVKGTLHVLYNDEMTVSRLKEISRNIFKTQRVKEDSILLIIDEAQLIFNAREWNVKGRNEWLSFFTQHRKYGFHVILVAQFDQMIDRQIRSLVEYQYIHRKVSNFGIYGKIMAAICFEKLFVCVKVWYPLKEKVGSEFYTARKRYYSLYDTFLLLDEEREPSEEIGPGAALTAGTAPDADDVPDSSLAG